ncbi:2-keto-4-pentenoate hydratase [bacterium]|nr:2-keto-4-pentenoate hydratase [bacterium]
MLSQHQIEAVAHELRAAYSNGSIPPLRSVFGPTDEEAAYAVQECNTAFWQGEGRRIVGRKIGLTSQAVQKQLGVTQPDYGVLFDDMLVANHGGLSADRLLQPKAEAEIALVLAEDLDDPDADEMRVLSSTRHAVAALEIVDSRIADWKITFADTVADNASSAAFVLGDIEIDPRTLRLADCRVELRKNGADPVKGVGSACMGDPLRAAAWLASMLARRGAPLRAGDIVLTGALAPMIALQPGDWVEADFDMFGKVSFTYKERV